MQTQIAPAPYRMLKCMECGDKFRYSITKSPNYPKSCPECRRKRNNANKLAFERSQRVSTQFPMDTVKNDRVVVALDEIPDYTISPTRLIDMVIRGS